jgi:hypothetical protein
MVQLVDAMLAKTPEARPSLAAVRTVIKRLRTTQLPTRSMAGVEIAIPAAPALGISASRVGAQAMLPGDSRMPTDTRRAQSPNAPPGPGTGVGTGIGTGIGNDARRPSNPNLAPFAPSASGGSISGTLRGSAVGPRPVAPPSHPSSPLPSHPPSHPGVQRSRTNSPSSPPSNPALGGPASSQGDPRPRAHSPSNPAPGGPASNAGQYPLPPRTAPAGSQPLETSSDGLRASAHRTPPTRLGVGPPVPRPPAFQPVPRRTRRTWLVVAILLVIAAAAALAIALTGT